MIAAAVLAFGFVYIHPVVDGNGRIHRYLIHHVLAQRGFNPAGVVFPVSAAILERIDEYREVLEDYPATPAAGHRLATDGRRQRPRPERHRRFLSLLRCDASCGIPLCCVKKTIEEDLPRETEFLARYDRFRVRIEALVDMPERTVDLLFRFLHQNGGVLSKRAREEEFASLRDEEVTQVETAYREVFQPAA